MLAVKVCYPMIIGYLMTKVFITKKVTLVTNTTGRMLGTTFMSYILEPFFQTCLGFQSIITRK